MTKYINRDEVVKKAISTGLCDSYGNMYGAGDVVLVEDIQAIPATDAVPVVRCKDCRYRFTSLCPTHSVEYDMENEPEIMWGIEEDDGFCSHGEIIK